jgi:hypothetical protein
MHSYPQPCDVLDAAESLETARCGCGTALESTEATAGRSTLLAAEQGSSSRLSACGAGLLSTEATEATKAAAGVGGIRA